MNAPNATETFDCVHVNGIPILNCRMDGAIRLIEAAAARNERCCVFFANAHGINVSARDPAYHSILLREDAMVFGDGAGVRIAARIEGQPLQDNVNGTDLFPVLCQTAADTDLSLFFLGSRPGIPDEVRRRMTAQYPGLRIAGVHHGYFDDEDVDALIDTINESGAHILLVGLGVPYQELWIARYRERVNTPVMMGVGGLFDYYSGRIPRAPKILRMLWLEWLWRLAMEPRRMWKRYLVGNFTFMVRILWWKLRGRGKST